MNKKSQIPDEYWKAIVENDSSYDDRFFYGVVTTGIFCRPSCKSRAPRIENVVIFKNAKMALSEKFRPCKRCKPEGLRLPDHEWVQQIVEWIDQNFNKHISLEKLAEVGHGSPYHLQRTFKRLKGMSPLEYIQQVRIDKAIHFLMTTNKTISNIGMAVGLSNTPYFITLFKNKTGFTPVEYRKKGETHS